MTARRMVFSALGAAGPLALLALLFGNQWVTNAFNEHDVVTDRYYGPLVGWLQFPRWQLTGEGLASYRSVGYILALDFSTLLFIVVAGVLVVPGVRALHPDRALFGAFAVGWWATFVAGGLTGTVRGVLLALVLDAPSVSTTPMVYGAAGQGLGFALEWGWLAGAGVLVAFLLSRADGPLGGARRGARPGAPGQAAAPMGGQPLPARHPASTPYVPPGGQSAFPQPGYPQPGPQHGYPQPGPPSGYPQQGYAPGGQPPPAGWGSAPAAPSPSGAPPQPPVPAPRPEADAPAEAPEAAGEPADAPEAAAEPAEPAEPAKAPAEPPEAASGAVDAAAEPPADDSEPADLAEVTMIDPARPVRPEAPHEDGEPPAPGGGGALRPPR